MSADNGVYILETKGPEYRIAYAHNIDSIYGKFDDITGHWLGNLPMIRETFGNREAFSDLKQALDIAEHLSYDYQYLEDGICVISNFKDLDFNSIE